MTRRKNTLLAARVASLALLLLAGAAWIAARTIAWACDLPNRITIDVEIDGEALGAAITEAIRSGLRATDTAMQLQTINSLADGAAQNPGSLAWIRDEYAADRRTAEDALQGNCRACHTSGLS